MDVTMIALVLCVLGFFYWYLTRTFDYWKDRNVPSLATYPLIGSSREILRLKSHASLVFQSIYNQYPNERVVGGFIGRTPELLLRDPEIIKLIAIKEFNHFMDHNFNFNADREPLTQNLLFLNGNKWKRLRQRLTPTFSSAKMKKMFPLIVECGVEFQEYLSRIEGGVEAKEIRQIMAKFTMEVIGSCAFGIKLNSLRGENSKFIEMAARIFEPSATRGIKRLIKMLSNTLYEFLNIHLLPMEVELFFLGTVKSILQSRNYTQTSRNDFVDLLIELKNSSSIEDKTGDIEITDDLIAAQAFVFFGAGFETSSATMAFALYELAKNPNVQDKLVEEITTTLKKHDNALTYEAVRDMEYLDMVIDETLRKYPPFGFLNRVCNSDYHFKELGFKVDKGILLNIPIYALHHDPQYFPEPKKFIPERFTAVAKESRNAFSYLPFGEGPRMCIALRFGKLQTKVGLISLLQNFTVSPNLKTDEDITFEPKTFVLRSKDGIWLNLTRRSKLS